MIVAQLSQRPRLTASLHSAINPEPGASIEDLSARILDRVKIMRVFDFVGVREAIEELKDDIAGQNVAEPTLANEKMKEALPVEKVKMKRTYVADSEDEEDDEVMLFDSETIVTVAAQPAKDQEGAEARLLEPVGTLGITHAEAKRGYIKFMLVDSFAHVFNPLLKTDYIRGIWSQSHFH